MRQGKGLKQRQLADASQVGQTVISRIELGAEPTLRTARRLARALEMSIDELFPETDVGDEERGTGGGTGRSAG